jgi:cardiolipin synthase A/B
MSTRSLLIMPDDGIRPLLDAIEAAGKNIRVKMFIFSDPDMLQAVIAGKKRGIEVRVMLNPSRRDGEEENVETRKALEAVGIQVMDSNPEFGITHEKSMVVDDKIAYIKSLNWETRNLTETRDYVIITTHPHEVKEVMECFDADWDRHEFNSGEDAHLIWCTGNGRTRIAAFINEAKKTLFIQNERFQDIVVIERIVRAASRGVKVHIMVAPPDRLKKGKLIEEVSGLQIMNDYGIKIHELRGMKLHGKMLLADGKKAIIGSINFAPGSFDDRRELAIEVDDKAILDRLRKIAKSDWKNSRPFDLSDEGLEKDLVKHNDKKAAKKLALDDDFRKPDKHKNKKNKKDKKK